MFERAIEHRDIDFKELLNATEGEISIRCTEDGSPLDCLRSLSGFSGNTLAKGGKTDEKDKNEERKGGMDAKTRLVQKFMAIAENIPEGRWEEALHVLEIFAAKTKHEPPHPLPADQTAMKALKIETYPEYKKRTGSTDGRECLKANWKNYLKAFNPALDRDHMCQADLAKLDRKLLERLRHTTPAEELGTFLPSLKDYNRQQVARMSEQEIKEAYRKKNLVNRHLDAA